MLARQRQSAVGLHLRNPSINGLLLTHLTAKQKFNVVLCLSHNGLYAPVNPLYLHNIINIIRRQHYIIAASPALGSEAV